MHFVHYIRIYDAHNAIHYITLSFINTKVCLERILCPFGFFALSTFLFFLKRCVSCFRFFVFTTLLFYFFYYLSLCVAFYLFVFLFLCLLLVRFSALQCIRRKYCVFLKMDIIMSSCISFFSVICCC